MKIFEIAILLPDNNQLHNLQDVISVICYFVADTGFCGDCRESWVENNNLLESINTF